MKIPTNPPKTIPLKDWTSFVAASQQPVFAKPLVVVVETSQQYQDLQRRLQSQVRPFAIALLAPRN